MLGKQKEDFKDKLKNLKEYVALATVESKDYQKTNLKIIKHLTEEQNIPGVYITLNRPYESMNKILSENNIDTKMILFIDAITKIVGGNVKKKGNCLFIGSPEKLSDISIAMDQAVRSLPDEKFVFFDSLSILLLYNNPQIVAKFIHFLSGKMRVWHVRGIIIS